MKKPIKHLAILLILLFIGCVIRYKYSEMRKGNVLKKTPKAEKWIAFENSELTQMRADFRATFEHDTSDVFDVSYLFANKTKAKNLSDFTDTTDVIDMSRLFKKTQ